MAHSQPQIDSMRDRIVEASIAELAENRGIVPLLQLPAPHYSQIFHELFRDRLVRSFRYNMTVLSWLVRDVQNDEVIPLEFTSDNAPYDELVADDLPLLMRAASVGMSSLGCAVWLAGANMPSRDIEEKFLETAAIAQHVRWITRSIVATTGPEGRTSHSSQ